MIDGEHRVHMAGEKQLHRRFRTDLEMEVPAVRNLDGGARRVDGVHRRRVAERDLAGQSGESIRQGAGNSGQPVKVARAAVDRGPGFDLREHRRVGAALDGRFLDVGKTPHGGCISSEGGAWLPDRLAPAATPG